MGLWVGSDCFGHKTAQKAHSHCLVRLNHKLREEGPGGYAFQHPASWFNCIDGENMWGPGLCESNQYS